MAKKLTIKNLHRIKGIQIYIPTINNYCTVGDVLGEESGYERDYYVIMRIGGVMTSHNDMYTIQCRIDRRIQPNGNVMITYEDWLDGVLNKRTISTPKRWLMGMDKFINLTEEKVYEIIIRWVNNRTKS
jgi:hypothetical protein